jgi:hypothetical protein
MQMYETRQPLTWSRLALVAVVIGAILAAGATKMNGGVFGGEPALANVQVVPPAVTPAAVPLAKTGPAAVDSVGGKVQPGRKSGTAALSARLNASSPVRLTSAPENPFRWQGRGSSTVPHTLTFEELDEAAVQAGWPRIDGWWPEMRKIITEFECPSLSTHCYNGADPNGGSYGLAQLNGRDHFDSCGEQFEMRYDPVVNLRVALCVRAALGHFGGPGGWGGADVLGIR